MTEPDKAASDLASEAPKTGIVLPFRTKKLTGFIAEDTAPSEYVAPEKDPA